MKINYLSVLIVSLLFASLNVTAQTNSELKKEINNIKKNPTLYLYAEATLPDKSEALNCAIEELQEKVNKWCEEQKNSGKTNTLIVFDAEHSAQRIEIPRGNMFRAFVYAEKSKITGPKNNYSQQKAHTQTATVEKTVVVSEEKKSFPPAIERMLPFVEYSKMAECIKQLKTEGLIEKYARYKSDITDIEKYALVIYNADGKIEAILSPGKNRINYKTNAPDNFDNYKGGNGKRGALIIKLK